MPGRDIAGGLSKAAAAAAKLPLEAAEQAMDVAKGAVAKGAEAAGKLLHGSQDDRVEVTQPTLSEAAAQMATERLLTGEDVEDATGDTPDEAAGAVLDEVPEQEVEHGLPPEPQIVLAEPGPPAEPPIDIVGQVLAAEEEAATGGRAGEPKASTRDEEHGVASLQRAEEDEIAEEIAEAFPAGQVGVATPVGTTGADVGFNPDTAEADLQQPGTEPLVDPSLTKQVKAEQETLHRAADPDKG